MEDMDHEIDIVNEDPPSTSHSLYSEGTVSDLPELFNDIVGNRGHVGVRPTTSYDEEVGGAFYRTEIEKRYPLGFSVEQQLDRASDVVR